MGETTTSRPIAGPEEANEMRDGSCRWERGCLKVTQKRTTSSAELTYEQAILGGISLTVHQKTTIQ